MQTPILDMLKKVAGRESIRFCMPGHKGKAGFFGAAASAFDITELPGADNLYLPSGVIAKAQQLHAAYTGAGHSFFLVNGSSAGVQAAVMSVMRPKEKIIVARDIHLSAVNAFVIAGVQPVFVQPTAKGQDLPCVVSARDIELAVRAHQDAQAVYVTYPNYYGMCADLNEICAIAHRYDLRVICDAAHAAAFDFSTLLPVSPAAAGCDIWTSSLHKTLPAMNQCAVLSIGEKSGIDPALVQSRLNMLQTTSPSYVLLGSCDYALAYMREKGEKGLLTAVSLVEDNIRKIEALGGYRCVTKDIPHSCGAYDRDILRLVIDVTDRGISGFGAAKILEKNGIYVEMADTANIVLVCALADTAEEFSALRSVLKNIQGANYHIGRKMTAEEMAMIYGGEAAMPMRAAAFAPRMSVSLMQSVGQVSAVSVGAYPPGVPVLMPGQVIQRETIEYLVRLKQYGYHIFGSDGSIEVVCPEGEQY